ncbi:calcium/sodium antiporter [Nanoarchaeota archaeon]
MMLISNLIIFIAGLVLLVKGADFFVKSAAAIAKKLGVSEFVIGLTLVAIGTSVPELAAGIAAVTRQASGIVIGNVVGSNIANIGLVVGFAAMIATIKTKEEMLRRDGYIMLFAAVLFTFMIIDLRISRLESGILLLFYVVYILFLLEEETHEQKYFLDFIDYFFKMQYVKTLGKLKGFGSRKKKGYSILSDVFFLALGALGIIIGSNAMIEQAINFADYFGLSSTVIGFTLVALGTSLPELSVTVSAFKKGYGSIALGNIIGSNIANIFLILGVTGVMFALPVTQLTLYLLAPFMVFISLLLLVAIKSGWELKTAEGIFLIIIYVVFLVVVFL